jgi:hypothetical protein
MKGEAGRVMRPPHNNGMHPTRDTAALIYFKRAGRAGDVGRYADLIFAPSKWLESRKMMSSDQSAKLEMVKVEYEQALSQYQSCTVLRRQDMAFVTTAQGAVLAIIGPRLPNLDLSGIVLSLIAFFLLLLGINSERRLSNYMAAYFKRAREIEQQFGLTLVSLGFEEVQKRRSIFSNSIVFPLYYTSLMIAWIIIWVRSFTA